MIDVKFKKEHEDFVLPFYATEGAAAKDLTTVSDGIFYEKYIEYKFGFSMAIPKGYAGFIFPRSSISKTDLNLCNAVGIIDSDYRGEVTARFNFNSLPMQILTELIQDVFDKNTPNTIITQSYRNDLLRYRKGDRICQMVVLPTPEWESVVVDDLDETERGTGGYGHTGN